MNIKVFYLSRKPLHVAFFGLFLLAPSLVFATTYQPGQTLDPACPPSDNTCVVQASTGQWATSGSSVSYSGGNIGVGTTSPSALLTTDSTSTLGTIIRLSNASAGGHMFDIISTGSGNTSGAGRFDIFDKTAATSRFSIAANGNVGIGTTSPSATFAVAGDGYISGNFTVLGTLIASSSGIVFIQSGAGAVSRTVSDKLADTISVKDFGAKGDGSTDDTSAINAAITAATSTGKTNVVYFPCGTYNFTGITITTMVTLKGSSLSCSILKYTPLTGTAITENYGVSVRNASGITDLTLAGPETNYAIASSSGNSSIGLFLGGTNGSAGFYTHNIGIKNFVTGLMYGNNSYLTTFEQSYIANNWVNFIFPDGTTNSGEQIQFTDTLFGDSGEVFNAAAGAGIQLKGGLEMTMLGGSFDDSRIDIPANSGVVLKLTNNHFEWPGGVQPQPFITMADAASNVTITSPQVYVHSFALTVTAAFTASTGIYNAFGIDARNASSTPMPALFGLTLSARLNQYGTGYTTGFTQMYTNSGGGRVTAQNVDFSEAFSSGYFTGTLGIGTTTATAQLDIAHTGTNTLGNGALGISDGAGRAFQFRQNATGFDLGIDALSGGVWTNRLTILRSNGNVGIGTSSPYSKLTVWGADAASSTLSFNVVNSASTTLFAVFNGGNAQLSGTLTQSSDKRLKTNITNLDASSSLAAINSLVPVTYNWLDPEKGSVRQFGFIAQDVQEVFPDLVSTTSATALTPDGTLGLNYLGLISPLVKAVQELSKTVAAFAESFTSKKITTNQLCLTDESGTTCYTRSELDTAVNSNHSPVNMSAPTPPVITDITPEPEISDADATTTSSDATTTAQ